MASWNAYSARWRAAQGLCPLDPDACRRYVGPADIRGPLGLPIRVQLAEMIWRAWCAGVRAGAAAWLDEEIPAEPGGLWAEGEP